MLFIKTYLIPIADILIVATLIYLLYKLIAGTRTIQVLRGLVIIVLVYYLALFLELDTFLWLLRKGLDFTTFALVVIFQNEIRRIVMKLGENAPLIRGFVKRRERELVEVLPPAVYKLSEDKIGALIVITRSTALGVIIERGIKLDSIITRELIESIFMPKNPLHDGALVIIEDRIAAAGCLLPLTERTDLSKIFGTRHRAAIGLSEETDAVVVVVSEENGKISIAHEGKLYYDLKREKFESSLSRFLFKSTSERGDQFLQKLNKLVLNMTARSEKIMAAIKRRLSKNTTKSKNEADASGSQDKSEKPENKTIKKDNGEK